MAVHYGLTKDVLLLQVRWLMVVLVFIDDVSVNSEQSLIKLNFTHLLVVDNRVVELKVTLRNLLS